MNNSSLSNYSFNPVDLRAYKIGVPIFSSFITLWITLVNTVVIGIIVTSALRHELRYKLIVCVSMCDVTMNLMYNPFVAEFSITGAWVHGCFVQIVVQVVYNFGDTFLQLWYLVIIVAESAFRQTWIKRRSVMSRHCSSFLTILVLFTPLICGTILLPSLILTGVRQAFKDMWTSAMCSILLTAEREIVMSAICFYIPTLTSAGLLTYSAVRFQLQKRDFSIQNRIILEPNTKSESVLVFWAPWLAITLLALPEQVMVILYLCDMFQYYPQLSFDAFMTSACVDSLRLAVLPITWFLLPEVRDALKTRREILVERIRLYWSKTKRSDDTSVTYSDLKEDA